MGNDDHLQDRQLWQGMPVTLGTADEGKVSDRVLDADEQFVQAPDQRRFEMRKFVLIAAIATTWSTSCYANLSLAANEPAVAIVEQPRAQVVESRPAPLVKSSVVAKPRKRHLLGRAYPVRVFYRHCL